MEFYRPSWTEISAAALRHNVAHIRRIAGADVGLCAMVKADAYGHGAVQIAQWLEAAGAVAFGVAGIEEAFELRRASIGRSILIMGGLMGQGEAAARQMLEHRLTPVIHTAAAIEILEAVAGERDETIGVHLQIDTGMTRMGARPEQLPAILTTFEAAPHVQLEGVMSHLAHAIDPEVTARQHACFVEAATTIRARTTGPLIWHLANSSAVLNHTTRAPGAPDLCCPIPPRDGDQCWVRPGIMLYGIAPFPEDEGKATLAPVMAFKSQVTLIKQIPAGTRVSYSGTWEATRPTRLGIVPIGYADGYAWSNGGKAHVHVRGTRVPVVGRITMDMMHLDLTDLPASHVGDDVLLMGDTVDGALRAERVAQWSGTIPYEVVCRIAKRIPRVYQ